MGTETAAGMIFNIQHFSIHDGPGIRTTVFFKGCPLRCRWCHNPESWERRPELNFIASKCRYCRRCETVCPQGVHAFDLADPEKPEHTLDRSRCVSCGKCAQACYYGALELSGKVTDAKAVVDDVMRDKVFYDTSGGGLTVSGGEPLAQPEFLYAILVLARQNGLDTAIETSGCASPEVLKKLMPYVSRFLFDVKETDAARHREYTGVSNEPILSNLRFLAASGAQLVMRCPMIPGLNVRPDHFEALAALAAELRIPEIDVEPYHPLGLSKSAGFGKVPTYENDKFMEHGDAQSCADAITASLEARGADGVRVVVM